MDFLSIFVIGTAVVMINELYSVQSLLKKKKHTYMCKIFQFAIISNVLFNYSKINFVCERCMKKGTVGGQVVAKQKKNKRRISDIFSKM